jgi:hypothetical protein
MFTVALPGGHFSGTFRRPGCLPGPYAKHTVLAAPTRLPDVQALQVSCRLLDWYVRLGHLAQGALPALALALPGWQGCAVSDLSSSYPGPATAAGTTANDCER